VEEVSLLRGGTGGLAFLVDRFAEVWRQKNVVVVAGAVLEGVCGFPPCIMVVF